jgi:lysophospholipase L1-like esterase
VAVENRWPWIGEYDAAIDRVASRLNVPLWDARAAFRAEPQGNERLFLDAYHPNVAGHRFYARFLAERLVHTLDADRN